MNQHLVCSSEVKTALENGGAVVALETTIISHGFNYPENLECGRECERVIREEGAVPATIGIVDGRIVIGLDDDEIRRFAGDRSIPKCSRRDAAAIVAREGCGATTVAATMLFARMAGIRFFATGGIGGVHRGANQTFDISADLEELAQTEVAVICAGAKSILDIPLTLEYLETGGVTVLGYGTGAFPAFYLRDSGCAVDYRVENAGEAARMFKIKEELGLKGGVLICNPIPLKDEMESAFINGKIQAALDEAQKQGISGKAVTPFLLAELHKTTGGKSVEANKALVFNNARTAAQIALAYRELAGRS
ncbi:MAG: pseudouridine-5'-phosphate glycosidase [Treponema sp.]|jgi:pseudouridine-5'-phosphate glycosidase|nr:pseudouridine-5'-phosphate glycosidase [Treponema sp.]